jgi:ankyrin repeat protein
MTALMMASDYGHTAVCALLLDKGADMEAKDFVSGERDVYARLCVFVSACV